MDTIQYLFSALIRLAIALILVAIVWWLVSTLFPTLGARNLFSLTGTSTESGDWLPAPRNGLFGTVAAPNETTNVYHPGDAFNGYANAYNNNFGGSQVDYVTYTSTGTQIIHLNGSSNAVGDGTPDPNVTYVRNLSIYQGGHIYTGLTFTGDAREVMFKNGKFSVIILDPANRVVNTFPAVATGDWTIPGWVRFQVRINAVLPDKIPCAMVFEQAVTQYQFVGMQQETPIRVAIPVLCN